jgi:hypothetical protein
LSEIAAAIASYSTGRIAGARSSFVWHGTLSEMGMIVVSSTLTVGPIGDALAPMANRSARPVACSIAPSPRFADDLAWWTEAAKAQRARTAPPY